MAAKSRSRRCTLAQYTMVQLQRKNEKRGKKKGRARAGRVDGQRKEEEAQTLWGMLYADDAGIVG